jgi:hypothetical protein
MIKLITDKDSVSEAGAIIENGSIRPYKVIDLSDSVDHVRHLRDQYDESKAKNMHLLASVPADLVENVRIINKFPIGPEGVKAAIHEVVRMVKRGELEAFKVHGA